MPKRIRRKIIVYSRETLIRLKTFRFFLFTFFISTLIGAILLKQKYHISVTRAYYEAVTLMFFSSSLDYPTNDLFFELMWIFYPVFGLILLADGLTGIGVALKFGDPKTVEWNEEMAKVMKGHVIVVGVGNLGTRVLDNLINTTWDIVIIDKLEDSESEDIVEQYQIDHRIPLIKGDALREHILEKAGIKEARAVMILIDDDFLNLKIAMQARKLHPGIKIIMRMFDIEFGEEISKKLNLELLSTTKIAVDSFLEALDKHGQP